MKFNWQQLQERERWALLIGGSITLLYLIYLLIFSPLQHAVTEKHLQLLDKQKLQQWLLQAQKIKKITALREPISQAKLSSILSEALKQPPLMSYPFKIQQSQHDVVQLSFNEVPFQPFMQWFAQFSQKYLLNIETLSVEKTKTTGIVHLTLELRTQSS